MPLSPEKDGTDGRMDARPMLDAASVMMQTHRHERHERKQGSHRIISTYSVLIGYTALPRTGSGLANEQCISSPVGAGSIAISLSACLFFCLFVFTLAYLKNHTSKFHQFDVKVECASHSLRTTNCP